MKALIRMHADLGLDVQQELEKLTRKFLETTIQYMGRTMQKCVFNTPREREKMESRASRTEEREIREK